jgi:hypothetical protein
LDALSSRLSSIGETTSLISGGACEARRGRISVGNGCGLTHFLILTLFAVSMGWGMRDGRPTNGPLGAEVHALSTADAHGPRTGAC